GNDNIGMQGQGSRIDAGAGNDMIYTRNYWNWINAGPGNDYIRILMSQAQFTLQKRTKTLHCGPGTDYIMFNFYKTFGTNCERQRTNSPPGRHNFPWWFQN